MGNQLQHYVPRFMLRRFGKGRKEHVHVLDKQSGHCFSFSASRKAVISVAAEYGMYDFDFMGEPVTIEPGLADLETKAAGCVRRIADAKRFDLGEQYTPRDVIELMVTLLFSGDDDVLSVPGVVRTMYDPTAGTAGILSVAEEYLRRFNSRATLKLFGQELEDETYAICKADMLIRGQDPANIANGDTLDTDKHAGKTFEYQAANPPYGVEWKPAEASVRKEHGKGAAGRFQPGLPAIRAGQMLFSLHLLSKMQPVVRAGGKTKGGGRFRVVHNGSPLFTGDAGSGESEIRRHILQHDYLDCIVALPTDMFYNTNITTYLWFMSNRKPAERPVRQ